MVEINFNAMWGSMLSLMFLAVIALIVCVVVLFKRQHRSKDRTQKIEHRLCQNECCCERALLTVAGEGAFELTTGTFFVNLDASKLVEYPCWKSYHRFGNNVNGYQAPKDGTYLIEYSIGVLGDNLVNVMFGLALINNSIPLRSLSWSLDTSATPEFHGRQLQKQFLINLKKGDAIQLLVISPVPPTVVVDGSPFRFLTTLTATLQDSCHKCVDNGNDIVNLGSSSSSSSSCSSSSSSSLPTGIAPFDPAAIIACIQQATGPADILSCISDVLEPILDSTL